MFMDAIDEPETYMFGHHRSMTPCTLLSPVGQYRRQIGVIYCIVFRPTRGDHLNTRGVIAALRAIGLPSCSERPQHWICEGFESPQYWGDLNRPQTQ